MYFSLFDIVFKKSEKTISIAHLDNGIIGSALFGVSLMHGLVQNEDGEYEEQRVIFFDALYAFFILNQLKLLFNLFQKKGDKKDVGK